MLMGKNIQSIDPEQRGGFTDTLLDLDGLSHVEEDPKSASCPI
jgi:hypothetical protein